MSDNENQINSVEKDPVQDMVEILKKNQKAIIGLLGSLLLAFGVYSGVKQYQHSAELEAQAKLFKIEKQLEKVERGLQKKQVKREDVKFDESYKPIAGSLESFIKSNQGKKASLRASIMLARLYGEFSQNDKALEAINLVNPPVKADMLNVLFHTQKITQFIDNEKYDDAIKLADKLLGMKEISFTHAMAKLKKAVAVEAKGDLAEAKALYKQVSEDYPEHPAGKTAKQYLRISK